MDRRGRSLQSLPGMRACPHCHSQPCHTKLSHRQTLPSCTSMPSAIPLPLSTGLEAMCVAAYFANFKTFPPHHRRPLTVIRTDHTFHIKCRWIHDCAPRVVRISPPNPPTTDCQEIKLNLAPVSVQWQKSLLHVMYGCMAWVSLMDKIRHWNCMTSLLERGCCITGSFTIGQQWATMYNNPRCYMHL